MAVRFLAGGLAVALVAAAAPAHADGWQLTDLGNLPDRATCMSAAERALRGYVGVYGGGFVDVTNWVVYGYDLAPGDHDVLIMCPLVEGIANAFVVLHEDAAEGDDDREIITDRIEQFFNRAASGL